MNVGGDDHYVCGSCGWLTSVADKAREHRCAEYKPTTAPKEKAMDYQSIEELEEARNKLKQVKRFAMMLAISSAGNKDLKWVETYAQEILAIVKPNN